MGNVLLRLCHKNCYIQKKKNTYDLELQDCFSVIVLSKAFNKYHSNTHAYETP